MDTTSYPSRSTISLIAGPLKSSLSPRYHVIKNAATIAMLYFTLFFCGGIAISVYEGLPLLDCLYEAASAVGTVGLTLGITPGLHIFSQVVLIILMYLGRVGGLTLIYAVFSGRNKGNARLPLEKITVG